MAHSSSRRNVGEHIRGVLVAAEVRSSDVAPGVVDLGGRGPRASHLPHADGGPVMAGRLDLVDQCDREVRVRNPADRVAMLSDPVPAGARAPWSKSPAGATYAQSRSHLRSSSRPAAWPREKEGTSRGASSSSPGRLAAQGCSTATRRGARKDSRPSIGGSATPAAGRMPGRWRAAARRATAASVRARDAPGQRWRPTPKARW